MAESVPPSGSRKPNPGFQPQIRNIATRVLIILSFGVAVGLIGSFSAVAFVEVIQWINDKVISTGDAGSRGFHPFIFIAPVIAGLIVGALLLVSNQPKPLSLTYLVYAVQSRRNKLSARVGIFHTLAAIIGMGGGASVGIYGPLSTLGATIGGHLGQLSRADLTLGIGCGVAAAISTAFNAPIAAILFVHEVILRHYSLRAFAPITVASSTGFFISNYLLERPALFRVFAERSFFAPEFLAFVLIGVAGALVATLFMQSILIGDRIAARIGLPDWTKPAIAGLGVGLTAQWIPEVFGVGTQLVTATIAGEAGTPGTILIILLAKILVTALCLGFGFVGGVFSPALIIGVLSGALMGQLCLLLFGEQSSGLAVYAICGMMAVTSPVIGAPLTAILIVFELTRNYELTTAVMISVAFSNVVAYRMCGRSLFDRQLSLQGFDLSQGRDKVILERTTIAEHVTTDAVLIQSEQPLIDALHAMIEADRTECYVLDDLTRYQGKLRLFDIVRLQKRIDIEQQTAGTYADPEQLRFSNDMSVWEALELMREFVGESIPIIDQRGYFIGIIYESTLVAAYLDTLKNLRAEENAAS
ncbi:MAG: chloride channel protein [bacterium]